MLYIYLTTSKDVTLQYIIQDRTDYSVDHYIDLVCESEKCPKSAIIDISICEV